MKLEIARRVAEDLRDRWAPFCERIEVAGSIRRECSTVKDVELVAIPRWGEVEQGNLFDAGVGRRVNLLQVEIERWVAEGTQWLTVIKPGTPGVVPWRLKPEGRYWRLHLGGSLNLKVDLFLPLLEAWGLVYAIRTGSGVGHDGTPWTGFAPALLRRWKEVSPGGRAEGGRLMTGAPRRVVPTPEELDVFEALRLRWVPPPERRSDRDVAAARLTLGRPAM